MRESPFFYVPPPLLSDPSCISLPPDEAAHAARVLRRRPGDEVQVVNGEGHWYRVRLNHVSRECVTGVVLEHCEDLNEPAGQLHIGLSLLKSRPRFEAFLDQAVQLGVTAITPMVSERTEVRSFRRARARQILIAAMKQCRRCRIPQLEDPVDFIEVLRGRGQGLGCVLHPAEGPSLLKVIKSHPARDVSLLVGPEGGFTPAEIRAARRQGYVVASLGPRRLRSETAAVVAAATVAMHTLQAYPVTQ